MNVVYIYISMYTSPISIVYYALIVQNTKYKYIIISKG